MGTQDEGAEYRRFLFSNFTDFVIALLYTSIPLNAVSAIFSAIKIEPERVFGSVAAGIRIEKMSIASLAYWFVLEQLSFKQGCMDFTFSYYERKICMSTITADATGVIGLMH